MKYKIIFPILLFFTLNSLLFARGELSTDPSEIFKGCAKCHGLDGKNPAFGRSEALAGQDVEDLVESINFFKESKFESKGVILVMAKQVKHLNEEQIENLAIFISKLGKAK